MRIKIPEYLFLILSAVLLFPLMGAVYSQERVYYFEHISVEQGLSNSTVNCQMQDSRGFMWFGTEDGLNRYDGYRFRAYRFVSDDNPSISDNSITALFEDKQGNIWIGTNQGVLNKFNPVTGQFSRYMLKTAPLFIDLQVSILSEFPVTYSRYTDKTITCINQDKEGALWIGTWGKGLFKFDKSKGRFLRHFFTDAAQGSLSSNYVLSLIEDRSGIMWIGTFDGGLNKLVRTPGVKEADDKYYFVSYLHNPRDPLSLSDNRVVSLLEDRSGGIWAGTYGGGLNKVITRYPEYLHQERAQNNSFKRFSNFQTGKNNLPLNRIMKILEGRNGQLWIATFGGGIARFDYNSGKYTYLKNKASLGGLSDNDIVSVYEDRSGLLWVSTYPGKGIYRLNLYRNIFRHYKYNEDDPESSLSDNLVWAFDGDAKGNIWIGTYNGGLNKFNPATGKFRAFKHVPDNPASISSNHVRAVCVDKKGFVWAGTYNSGLNLLNESGKKVTTFIHDGADPYSLCDNRITSLLEDSRGELWIGTAGGLDRLVKSRTGNADQYRFIHYRYDSRDQRSLSDNKIVCIYEDKSGNIWIGTAGGGLNQFNRLSGKFRRYKHNTHNLYSLNESRILSILEDEDRNLWIGTQGGGLYKYDRNTEKFSSVSSETGMRNKVICGILEDKENNIWLSTDNGISKLNPAAERFVYYDLHHGLQSMEFSQGAYYKDNNGMMYFGGINGFNCFFPADMITNKNVPPVVISSVKVLNNELGGEQKEITLSGSGSYFSAEFSALDFSNPEQNQYAYMLEGYDRTWHYTDASARTASYNDLPPGSYTLRVKAANNDGIWNEKGTQLSVVVLPPFWKTWWFRIISLILLGGISAYSIYHRIRQLLAIERLKSKLAADLHDNVGSGLTEISILSEVISYQLSSAPQEIKEKLSNISETSGRLIDSMSDIVWVVNPRRDSLYDLILRLKDSNAEVFECRGISLKINNAESLKNIRLPMEYRQNLYLMFKEGINNSVKYSGCSNLFLDVALYKRSLEISLRDDGCGFDLSSSRDGNGLLNMKQRAEALGGRILIESEKSRGTLITFKGQIPRHLFWLDSFRGRDPFLRSKG